MECSLQQSALKTSSMAFSLKFANGKLLIFNVLSEVKIALVHPLKSNGIDGVVLEWNIIWLTEAPNDTAYKRWSCHSGHKQLCKLCRALPPPAIGARFTVFLGKLAMRTVRCSSQKRLMTRLIQVRQLQTNESRFSISAINKYTLGSRYPESETGLKTGCTSDAQVFAKNNTHIPGPAIYTDNTDSQLAHTKHHPIHPDPGPIPLPTPHLHHPHH